MTISRRKFAVSGIGGLLALSAHSKGYSLSGRERPSTNKIDMHHHFLPSVFVDTVGRERLANAMPNKTLPTWSVQSAIDLCDQTGTSKAILSISPGYKALSEKIETPLMRKTNESAAEIRNDHPTRFGFFASIPMFDRDKALKEIEYSLDELKADGIVVFSNYSGKYLGDSSFHEIWQELNQRKAVVFVHPTSPPYSLNGQPSEAIVEYPFETTRTAISLVYNQVTLRYPNIKFILSHAGGTLPYLAGRIIGGSKINPVVREKVPDVAGELRKFWFDTALSASPSSLAALLEFADPKRIVFGTDFPFAPSPIIQAHTRAIDTLSVPAGKLEDISSGNAVQLLSGS